MSNNEKKKIGRKKNADKKVMTGVYHRPSEINALGGIAEYKNIIYASVNDAIQKNAIKNQ
jgi:hypothetical protein